MKIPHAFEFELRDLKTHKILTEVKPDLLPEQLVHLADVLEVKVLAVSCCDGHQFLDTTRHVGNMLTGHRGAKDHCLHWSTENGGPFVLSVPSLAVRSYRGHEDHVDRNLLASMEESIKLKGMNVIMLIAHCRCGKVKDHFTNLHEYCNALAAAKKRVLNEFNFPRERVLAWLQIHRANGDRTTYHLNTSKMMWYISQCQQSKQLASIFDLCDPI